MNKQHDLAALKQYHQGSLAALLDTLTKKSEFIKQKYNSELTEPLMKKLKIEEEHVNISLEYIENVDKLIKAMEKEIVCKNMVLDFFKSEAKEYMDKYFNSIELNMEYQAVKEIIRRTNK